MFGGFIAPDIHLEQILKKTKHTRKPVLRTNPATPVLKTKTVPTEYLEQKNTIIALFWQTLPFKTTCFSISSMIIIGHHVQSRASYLVLGPKYNPLPGKVSYILTSCITTRHKGIYIYKRKIIILPASLKRCFSRPISQALQVVKPRT